VLAPVCAQIECGFADQLWSFRTARNQARRSGVCCCCDSAGEALPIRTEHRAGRALNCASVVSAAAALVLP